MVKKIKSDRLASWDTRVKYAVNIIFVICVYTILFEMRRLDAAYDIRYFGRKPASDIRQLLGMLSGIPAGGVITDIQIYQWLLAASVIFILVGREVYERQNRLKYMAMLRFGTYRKFYYHLMNRAGFQTLLYGGTGMLVIFVLYAFKGNGQVGGREFLEMCGIYLPHLMLLCLLQTACMIGTGGYAASVVLLIFWLLMIVLGDWFLGEKWVWLPGNWGMYIRSAWLLDGGVPISAYYIQAGMCVLLWAVVPLVIKRKR